MKTKVLSIMGLGLAVVCLCLAPQSSAIKGGIPANPGGEDPPPEPRPISYQPAVIEVPEGYAYLASVASINNYGEVAGVYDRDYPPTLFRMAPEMGDGEVVYRTNNMMPLCESIDLPFMSGSPQFWINNYGQIAGTYDDYSNGLDNIYRATVWPANAPPIDLGVTEYGIDNITCAFNDDGLVVVWTMASNTAWVVVPDDHNGDGIADIWFADENGDGINDLLCPLPSGDFGQPTAINASGVVVFHDGVVVVPDWTNVDEDGVGNPWVGGNAVTAFLQPLQSGDWVEAHDINDDGQIVGCSGHPVGGWDSDSRATIWKDINNPPIDLGGLSGHSSKLVATGINNAGQIIGSCREKKTSTTFLIHEEEMFSFQDLLGLSASELTGWNVGRYGLVDINDDGWVASVWGAVCIPVYPEP